MKTTK